MRKGISDDLGQDIVTLSMRQANQGQLPEVAENDRPLDPLGGYDRQRLSIHGLVCAERDAPMSKQFSAPSGCLPSYS